MVYPTWKACRRLHREVALPLHGEVLLLLLLAVNRAGHLVLILCVLVLQALAINVEFQVDHRLIVLLFGVFKVLGASTQLLV